jgi:hypothetical protein
LMMNCGVFGDFYGYLYFGGSGGDRYSKNTFNGQGEGLAKSRIYARAQY